MRGVGRASAIREVREGRSRWTVTSELQAFDSMRELAEMAPIGWQPLAARSVAESRSGMCSISNSSSRMRYDRNIPRRKSDVKDAIWIADLLAHGLFAR
jgi:hypothetical protein